MSEEELKDRKEERQKMDEDGREYRDNVLKEKDRHKERQKHSWIQLQIKVLPHWVTCTLTRERDERNPRQF